MLATKKAKLNVDVINYFLTPSVRVLSEKEKAKILEKFDAQPEQFPAIFETDPLAKALKLKPGDMIEITRDDGTGRYKAYRICIAVEA